METFFKSLYPLWRRFKRIRKYWLEVSLILVAVIVIIFSINIYLKATNEVSQNETNIDVDILRPTKVDGKIYVDVSGSVKNPDLYKASNGQRLKNLIDLAGGLADDADRDFFARNFNLAKVMSDQEKVYVPSVWEVSNGYFIEITQTLDHISAAKIGEDARIKISLNEATLEELDTLPGVGKVTAQKIVDNRPFGALQELIDKKVLGKSAFEKVRELIEI